MSYGRELPVEVRSNGSAPRAPATGRWRTARPRAHLRRSCCRPPSRPFVAGSTLSGESRSARTASASASDRGHRRCGSSRSCRDPREEALERSTPEQHEPRRAGRERDHREREPQPCPASNPARRARRPSSCTTNASPMICSGVRRERHRADRGDGQQHPAQHVPRASRHRASTPMANPVEPITSNGEPLCGSLVDRAPRARSPRGTSGATAAATPYPTSGETGAGQQHPRTAPASHRGRVCRPRCRPVRRRSTPGWGKTP